MPQLQIATCQSALGGFLNLVSFFALPNCFFFLYWWEQKTVLCPARWKAEGERQY